MSFIDKIVFIDRGSGHIKYGKLNHDEDKRYGL